MTRNQVEEKRMLLEQLYNISLQIEELFLKLEINDAVILIDRKDKIIKQHSMLKDVRDESFSELKEKIRHQEEKNLELSASIKDRIGKELQKLNKNVRMNNLYGNTKPKGSIVDITE